MNITEFFLWYFSANDLKEIVINHEFNRLNEWILDYDRLDKHNIEYDYDIENIIISNIKTYFPSPGTNMDMSLPIQILYKSDYKYPKGIKRPIYSNKYITRTIDVYVGIYYQWVRDKKIESVLL